MDKLQYVLKELREDHKLSQKEIAEKINVTKQAYGNYENGTRNIPIETLIKLADYYKVSLDYIAGRYKNK